MDPANKYLMHAAIESSEVLDMYSGKAVLDERGEAVVKLPEWFEKLNTDFRYQLTAIGQLQRMQQRATPEAMRLRRATVEHPFANIRQFEIPHLRTSTLPAA